MTLPRVISRLLISAGYRSSETGAALVVSIRRSHRQLKAQIGYKLSALVLDCDRTIRALERGLGVFVAERRGLLVIGFGCARILRSAAPALGKGAHPLQCRGMTLRRRLFEQISGG